jgi:putative tricarboxylic transport membrane protein
MIEGILIGLKTALSFQNLLMVIIGCFAGTIIGMLPGLGPMTAIALMIPITYGFEPSTGLILMAGVYYGAVFGGSTSSILINAPGVPGTVATSFDGYPMAQQGKAGKALAIAAYSSFAGGTIAAIFLLIAAPSLSKVSLSFRSPDYFALMILGLTAVAAFSSKGNFLKAMMMCVFGLMLASVGQDSLSDITRFTFNNMNLSDGISFVLVVMATFAMSEALTIIIKRNDPTKNAKQISLTELGSIKLDKDEKKKMAKTIPRSSILGFIVGVLPGAGATIASFLAYGMERNFVSEEEKQKFGKGSVQGLCAPETANNAACSGAFVPLLTLGIPGSGTTAVMLGALLGFGIQPGPRLYETNPEIFWSVIMSMYIGMVVLLILNLPLIPYIARILAVPRTFLIPMILFFSVTGIYLMSFNNFDIFLMIGIAVTATILRLYDFPMPPLILAFVLGGLMEENLRRSLLISDGSWDFLWNRPLTLCILSVIIIIVIWQIFMSHKLNLKEYKQKSS